MIFQQWEEGDTGTNIYWVTNIDIGQYKEI